MREGLLAEFESEARCAAAIRLLCREGYRELDAFMPYPCKEIERALPVRRSPVPSIAFVAALAGAGGAYFVQWWTQAWDYPLNVGSRPAHSIPAYVPIVFETLVLFGAFAAFFGMLYLCRLPRLWQPVFEVDGFERASIDRFFVGVASEDPSFDRARLQELFEGRGALRVAWVGERGEEP